MKILIAVHHMPPLHSGGAEWRASRTARGLARAGHEVHVVCVDSIDTGDGTTLEQRQTLQDGVTVDWLSLNLALAPQPFEWRYRNPLIGAYVAGLLHSLRPDVLHLISGYLMSGSVLEAARDAGVPSVVTLTDFWFLCPRLTLVRSDGSLCTTPADPLSCALCLHKEQRRYRLVDAWSAGLAGRMLTSFWRHAGDRLLSSVQDRKAYLFEQLNAADVVLSPSRFLQQLHAAQGIAPRRFCYVRQGLDVDDWEAVGSESGSPSGLGLRIGYIGQIAKHKGVDVLLEAFLRLRAAPQAAPRLTFYGDPRQFPAFADRLRRRAAGRTDVVFAGRFSHAQIRRVHSEIDVLVVPSVWYENSPNVILEAFSIGTPLVVSRLGGMAELVEDGVNGFQAVPGDPADLARVLQRFVDLPELVDELRRNIPEVKTLDQEVAELSSIYSTLGVASCG